MAAYLQSVLHTLRRENEIRAWMHMANSEFQRGDLAAYVSIVQALSASDPADARLSSLLVQAQQVQIQNQEEHSSHPSSVLILSPELNPDFKTRSVQPTFPRQEDRKQKIQSHIHEEKELVVCDDCSVDMDAWPRELKRPTLLNLWHEIMKCSSPLVFHMLQDQVVCRVCMVIIPSTRLKMLSTHLCGEKHNKNQEMWKCARNEFLQLKLEKIEIRRDRQGSNGTLWMVWRCEQCHVSFSALSAQRLSNHFAEKQHRQRTRKFADVSSESPSCLKRKKRQE